MPPPGMSPHGMPPPLPGMVMGFPAQYGGMPPPPPSITPPVVLYPPGMGMGMMGGMPPGMVVPPGMMVPPGMGVAHPVGMVGGPVYIQGLHHQAPSAAPPSQLTAATTPEDATARLERKVTFLLYFSPSCWRTTVKNLYLTHIYLSRRLSGEDWPPANMVSVVSLDTLKQRKTICPLNTHAR